MAKYSYSPVAVDENSKNKPHGRAKEAHSHDEVVNERMPMAVGVCVLLAIVFVLSKSGSDTAPGPQYNESARVEVLRGSTNNVTTVSTYTPVSTSAVSSSSSTVHSVDLTPQTTTVHKSPASTNRDEVCAGLVDPANLDMGAVRQAAFAKTPPHIIECSAASAGESQSACHLPSATRFNALKQKGATLWMTGCSGAGKTTIATALEDKLVKLYGKHVYRLDGDNLRTGLNRDLGFSQSDREESVRRVGEIATLFADSGTITLVGLISPYRADRDAVRQRHIDQGIPFYEVFLDVPVDELKKRDPKGQYARVESGELKHFTCIDDPYEEPLNPEIRLKTHELTINQSAEELFSRLQKDGILEGAPQVNAPLPNPDGDLPVDLHVPSELRAERRAEAETLPKVRITDIELNWLQVIGEGWASPLRGFMREGELLQTLHFNSILVDPFDLTNNADLYNGPTEFADFNPQQPPQRVSMSVPITLSCTDFTKALIEESGKDAVALVTQMGETVAILRRPEVYGNRKEEIVARMFGVIDNGHPYVKHIYAGGDYLIGGEVELLDRIRYNDGLDKWRKTAGELMQEFQDKGADAVYAFQTRNPTHAGHAYLMKSAGENLKNNHGYKNPVLWLSPLGGWTKEDDVPLDVRIRQHEEVLKAGLTHPGGLDPTTTVMAIWPAPMVYAGPTEVQFHAKSRRSAGASYFVVGRDPAGMKGSNIAVAHKDDDLYHGDHGRYVLQMSPGLNGMQMLSFVKVMYDVSDDTMKLPDASRMDDFISISGSKMRALARQGATPCDAGNIPTDLLEANCVPKGFMVPKGWQGVIEYYQNINDSERWIPWSQPRVEPKYDEMNTKYTGLFGSKTFELKHKSYDSFWHDIPLHAPGEESDMINFITEIPMHVSAKMEVSKTKRGNPIMQDMNKDGSPRYYTYGAPFFNYGLIPQTWEDPKLKSTEGNGGDNDPLDVIEVGSSQLKMGSITPCRVLGSLELIDEGETDHKIICIHQGDADFDRVKSMQDLESIKPGITAKLVDWLKMYKTSDGKGVNELAQDDPTTVYQAMSIIEETHQRWKSLCKGEWGVQEDDDFWLDGAACRGRRAQ